MNSFNGYEPGYAAKNEITAPANLSVTETDLYVIKIESAMQKSEFTIYGAVTLGAVTSATFNYYYSPDGGTTWFPVTLYNTTNGEITQRKVVVDSGSYSTGGVSYFADNHQMGSATAFKVTGLSASGTPTLTKVLVMVRNN